jgi:hypothetical protein
MVQRKSGGGPKTPTGKAIASKNATKHNLRSEKPATALEQQNIVAYAHQLVEHYETTDPLEILQLERIALYRKKLATVYQAELASAQLGHAALENNPRAIVQEMSHLSDVARSRLLEYLDKGQWLAPCGLSIPMLDDITREIACLDVNLQSNADLERYLPALANFLREYHSHRVDSAAVLSMQLAAVAKRLEGMIEQGIEFRVKIDDAVDLIRQIGAEEERREKEREKEKEPDEFDLHIAQLQAELRAKMKVKPKPKPKSVVAESDPPIEPFPNEEEVKKQLKLFTKLQKDMISAIAALPQFESTKALRLQILALPNAGTDVLLRYQTTWERRLSAAIGEFLELRKRRGAQ